MHTSTFTYYTRRIFLTLVALIAGGGMALASWLHQRQKLAQTA
jgi:hypothetical protein